jgi:hypothetical protein
VLVPLVALAISKMEYTIYDLPSRASVAGE